MEVLQTKLAYATTGQELTKGGAQCVHKSRDWDLSGALLRLYHQVYFMFPVTEKICNQNIIPSTLAAKRSDKTYLFGPQSAFCYRFTYVFE